MMTALENPLTPFLHEKYNFDRKHLSKKNLRTNLEFITLRKRKNKKLKRTTEREVVKLIFSS